MTGIFDGCALATGTINCYLLQTQFAQAGINGANIEFLDTFNGLPAMIDLFDKVVKAIFKAWVRRR
ncbi:hypothetical protein C2W62_25165 [Candidatus Entotheonella serta]|nr:hypothetical protein C2W62_25165 [Candidatus Entotheonella serta]